MPTLAMRRRQQQEEEGVMEQGPQMEVQACRVAWVASNMLHAGMRAAAERPDPKRHKRSNIQE